MAGIGTQSRPRVGWRWVRPYHVALSQAACLYSTGSRQATVQAGHYGTAPGRSSTHPPLAAWNSVFSRQTPLPARPAQSALAVGPAQSQFGGFFGRWQPLEAEAMAVLDLLPHLRLYLKGCHQPVLQGIQLLLTLGDFSEQGEHLLPGSHDCFLSKLFIPPPAMENRGVTLDSPNLTQSSLGIRRELVPWPSRMLYSGDSSAQSLGR